MENNKRLASLLRQIAALLDEQGVAFKPAAYRRGAQVIEDLPRDVSTFKSEKELMELPGIGQAIAGKVVEYLKTGKIEALEKLLHTQGGISAELMEVEDMGPKRARLLQRELGIMTVADLVKAAEAGKIRSLPRFSEVMEKKILENAKRVKERVRRFPRDEVIKDAEMILKTLRSVPGVERSEIAGSYRREKSTIGDLDVLVVTRSREKVMDAIAKLPIVREVVARGETKMSLNLQSGMRVDIRFVKASQWGSALLYFTGSKEHNIVLRKRAIERGWKLNEYALLEGDKVIASREEKDIYKALGLPFVEPRERTEELPSPASAP
ncbi:MAG: nucleotidyltransferase domain-containing protein [Candidatus Peregrinibacteria bacterium]|nr:nucleotidyltransferase domain-containing protein [Candidatus Peregrinibacteria bacterium]